MTETHVVYPFHRLPPGYRRTLGSFPDPPVTPRPAATLALLREGSGGLEVLLLERSHRTRFIPGAFVFPGGRVDPADAAPEVGALLEWPGAAEADARLGVQGGSPPGFAFWVAALRETFEETGILLGGEGCGIRSAPLAGTDPLSQLRRALHGGETPFRDVAAWSGGGVGGRAVPYIGHWVTPVQERRRYDTRFFGAEVPADCPVFPDGVELVEALWITPAEALLRNQEGRLPMVFPTILTLQALALFGSPGQALKGMGGREIPRLLPRVEDTGAGVRMVLERGSPVHSFPSGDR